MKQIFFMFITVAFMAACNSNSSNQAVNAAGEIVSKAGQDATHAMLTVEGECDMCKERIEKTAKSVEGVTSALWEKESKQLHIDYDASKTSLEKISKAIAKVGHSTDKDKADQTAYHALPECCKKKE